MPTSSDTQGVTGQTVNYFCPILKGAAVGDVNGLRGTLGDVIATESQTRGIKMVEALRNAFVLTDGEGEFAEQHIAAIRMDFIERPTEFKTIEHLGVDTRTKKQIKRFIGKKLRRQSHGLIGKAQTIEQHPGDGFSRCNLLLCIGYQTCIDHIDKS